MGACVNHIIVNEDFNAAYGIIGWRRVPVLWFGLPLWMALRPQERIAVLGHEIAHGVNGDPARSFIVASALRALGEWIGILRAPLRHAGSLLELLGGYLIWPLSIPFAGMQSLLVQLLWLEMQRAEFFADYLGSAVSGTDAAVASLQKLGSSIYLDEVLVRHAYSTSQSGAYILGLFRERLASLPAREWQRLAHLAQREGARLDTTHPATGHRIEFLRSHSIAEPAITADASQMDAIGAELGRLHENLGYRLIARTLATQRRRSRLE